MILPLALASIGTALLLRATDLLGIRSFGRIRYLEHYYPYEEDSYESCLRIDDHLSALRTPRD